MTSARRGAPNAWTSRWRTGPPRKPVDPDAFGKFAESFARFMGTGRFLVYMTVFIIVWITFNVVGLFGLKWDPYPFILLNLIFSTQASSRCALILLAKNRQAHRDRVQYEQDRARDELAIANTEYLTREVAALRSAIGEAATRDFLRSELRDLLDELGAAPGPSAARAAPRSPSRPDTRPSRIGPAPGLHPVGLTRRWTPGEPSSTSTVSPKPSKHEPARRRLGDVLVDRGAMTERALTAPSSCAMTRRATGDASARSSWTTGWPASATSPRPSASCSTCPS